MVKDGWILTGPGRLRRFALGDDDGRAEEGVTVTAGALQRVAPYRLCTLRSVKPDV